LVVLRAICGKTFEANKVDKELADYPEYVCSRFCPEKSCSRYMEYFYNATHHNDPR
jgi:hypothetical protein